MSCISLDDWHKTETDLEAIDFIKLDVEGSEVAALRGMCQMLEKYGYPPIYMEINTWTLFLAGETPKSCVEYARSLGYMAYKHISGLMYAYNSDEFPASIVDDIWLVSSMVGGMHSNFVMPKATTPASWANGSVDRICDWLESICGQYHEHATVVHSICYCLKDYPRLYEAPKINALLVKIYQNRNADDLLIKKATDWISMLV